MLGSFKTSGDTLGQIDDVALIALQGVLGRKKFQFLLDSGASANFVSRQNLIELGIDWDLVPVK